MKQKYSQSFLIVIRYLILIALVIFTSCNDRPEKKILVWSAGGDSTFSFAQTSPSGDKNGGFKTHLSFGSLQNDVSNQLIAENKYRMHGAGVALGDINGDGRVDVYLGGSEGDNRLYINDGNLEFTDITASAGVACEGQFTTGVAFFDADGDGDLDLLVNALIKSNKLFLNDGTGIFSLADRSLGSGNGSTSLAIADFDLDGDLDFYQVNYKPKAMKDSLPPEMLGFGNIVIDAADGTSSYINPKFEAEYELKERAGMQMYLEFGREDLLFVNNGDAEFTSENLHSGRFLDAAGRRITSPMKDFGLAASFQDVNNDGFADLYVCNDFESPDYFWKNNQDGTFQAYPWSTIRSTSNASMAVTFSDIDRNGTVDAFVADMLGETIEERRQQKSARAILPEQPSEMRRVSQKMQNSLFIGRTDETWSEQAWFAGVQATGWTWGALFMDVDLDGYEDLLVANGHKFDVQSTDGQLREMAQNRRGVDFNTFRSMILQYPDLKLENLAYHNNGDGTFSNAENWHFGIEKDISHGMASADLDQDGDLDLVINKLGSPATLLENTSVAPRISVKLIGESGNTAGIGAKIIVQGGGLIQTKEITAGGLYLSSSEAIASFAGLTDSLSITVKWPSGKISQINAAPANHLYKIYESRAETVGSNAQKDRETVSPIFTDISEQLNFTHEQSNFYKQELRTQPLLPKRYSQLGPGISWYKNTLTFSGNNDQPTSIFSLNNNRINRSNSLETSELSDKSAVVSADINQVRWTFVGSSKYRASNDNMVTIFRDNKVVGSIKGESSVSSLLLGDVDGDGDLDLFIAGRLKARRWPYNTPSYLYINEDNTWQQDSTFSFNGLATAATFSDIDIDGDLDLVIAEEWGSVNVLINNGTGKYTNQTASLGLSSLKGLWNGIETGDFNGDGRPDIIATNDGLNTTRKASIEHPQSVYFGDLDGNGVVDIIETEFDVRLNKDVPRMNMFALRQALPFLGRKIRSAGSFANQSVEEIIGGAIRHLEHREINTLSHTIFLSSPDGFISVSLPDAAQMAPATYVGVADYDGDGNEDVFLTQNQFAVRAEDPRLDSGQSIWLAGDGKGGLNLVPSLISGVAIYGNQRSAAIGDFNHDHRPDLVVTQNGDRARMFQNDGAQPGITVKIKGRQINPDAVGAKVKLQFVDGTFGPVKEIKIGGGYLSQNSITPILAIGNKNPAAVVITWPAGQTSTHNLSADQHYIEITQSEL